MTTGRQTPIRFGTSGWRGVLAEEFDFAGVRALAAAVGRWVRESEARPRVVVAHDTRFLGNRFADVTERVLTAAGVRTIPARGPVPTPVASFHRGTYVRGLAIAHYENFSVLSRLVPDDLRDDFAAVYAFCRWSDDLGDETGADDAARARSTELLHWWRRRVHPASPGA